jgi:hypothetical protein
MAFCLLNSTLAITPNTVRLRFFDENSRKDAINRRLYEKLIIVETPIYRVSYLNRTVLP